jgi:tetratricopeptide (TPR) repeat protein
VRQRPPVGRRLWRRRRRRDDGTSAHATDARADARAEARDDDADAVGHAGSRSGKVHHDDDDRAGEDAPEDSGGGDTLERGGDAGAAAAAVLPWWRRLFRRSPPTPPTPPANVVDPVVEILALPRGAARLDAFERRLASLDPAGAEHRRVALAFHRELTGLADDAGVDLQLFEARVSACARALIAAGEDERAGALYARLGRRHQAAEAFVKAGAIDALEELHAEEAFAEGGARLDARLSFERFEALFLVGLRDDALAALERALSLWDNPVYAEVLAGFRARVPSPGRCVLGAGEEVVRVVPGLPVVLGRGEDSAVRIDSPLVSRAHVELVRGEGEGGAVIARGLVSAGGTRVDDAVPVGAVALGPRGTLQLAGVVLDYERNPQRLLLRARLRPGHVTLVALASVVDDALVGAPLSVEGGQARLVVDARARLNGDAIRRDTLLLVGDRVAVGGRTWIVSAR